MNSKNPGQCIKCYKTSKHNCIVQPAEIQVQVNLTTWTNLIKWTLSSIFLGICMNIVRIPQNTFYFIWHSTYIEVSYILEKQPIKLCHKGRYYDDENKFGGILHGALTKLSLSLASTKKN